MKSMEINKIYHVTTKSISKYIIFNNDAEYSRMKQLLQYYQQEIPPVRFSYFLNWQETQSKIINNPNSKKDKKLVKIIAYCIMPTHIHLIFQPLTENGGSIYMNRLLNSYTRYFNTKHRRKGPLWTSRFTRINVETDEYLIHLIRYIHLNPVTAQLIDNPNLWKFSSYHEYVTKESFQENICEFNHLIKIDPDEHENFVNDQISYQRELALIKHLIAEETA